MKRRIASWLLTIGVLVSLSLVGTMGGAAQAACAPIATGLVNPRFLAIADDGTVYVTEAGAGGTEPVPTPPGEGPGGPPGTRGLSGQITRIAPNGAKSVLTRDLPSYFQPAEGSSGPSGIALAGGALWVAVGGAGPGTPRVTPLPNENAVVRVNLQSGAVERIVDIGANERANNPDPNAVDSNLYGAAFGADGRLYVADAGGNTLYRVDLQTKALSVVAVFPGLPVTTEEIPPGFLPPGVPFTNPQRGGRAELDPVPTGVTAGPDGNLYVANLSGFPYVNGKARVLRVTPTGAVSDAATDLTMVVSVAFGPDGLLYVSQIATGFQVTGPDSPPAISPGAIVRVRPGGAKEVVLGDLNAPSGIAFDRVGTLYVAVNAAFGQPDQGQVLRCTGVAAPGMPGLPSTGAGGAQRSPVVPLALAVAALACALALVAARRHAARH